MGKYPDPIGQGAMWERTSSGGNEYLSGVLTYAPAPGSPPVQVKFVAFLSRKKTSDKSPDYVITVNGVGPAPARGVRPQPDPARHTPEGNHFPLRDSGSEDIPF